jgi:predicted transcriptional regulator
MAELMERTTVRFPAELKKRATALARRRKISFRELVRQAVEQAVGRPRKRPDPKNPFRDHVATGGDKP